MLKIGHFHGLLIIETIGKILLSGWVERIDISKVRSRIDLKKLPRIQFGKIKRLNI